MSIVDKKLKPPKIIREQVEKSAKRADEFIRSKKEKISDENRKTIEEFCDKSVSQWTKNTGKLRETLIKLNKQLEGVVEETNFPFDGASNITLHYAAASARTFKATFNGTLFQNPNLFIAEFQDSGSKSPLGTPNPSLSPTGVNPTDSKSRDDLIMDIEDAVNSTFSDGSNGLEVLQDCAIPTFRDGTTIISGYWERKTEMAIDSKTYDSSVEFVSDYPTADDAGVPESDYADILNLFLINPDMELRVEYEYEFVSKDGPTYEQISPSNFIFGPSYPKQIKDLEFYGKKTSISPKVLKEKGVIGEYYKKSVDKVLEATPTPSQDGWSASRNFIEGLSNPTDKDAPIDIADMVIKYDLDGDGVQEKYFVTFAIESKTILSFQRYPIRKNIDFCVAFRLLARDNRLLGVSLLDQTSDLFEEMDSIHRHRENIRMLVASPVFIAQSDLKDSLDPGRTENTIRPGTTFWAKDINNAVKQMMISNLDQPGNSLDEENLLNRYVELSIGTSQGMSGKQTPDDPRAPMGKTLALLNQANKRIDDYINEFSKSLPQLAELHVALLAQYGDKDGIDTTINRDGMPKKISVRRHHLLNSDLKWKFTKRSVSFSPEYVMQRLGGLMQVYMQLLPLIIKGDPVAIEIWNRMVIASGEPAGDKLIAPALPPHQITPPGSPAGQGVPAPGVSPLSPSPQGLAPGATLS